LINIYIKSRAFPISKNISFWEINDKGEIIRSLHDPSAEKVPSASEVEDKDGVLYFGSYYLPYISKLYLGKIKLVSCEIICKRKDMK
jgi:hypothetical protein